ncbi:eukaryotic translation initiation factor 2A [Trichomonascus vanleenenianus]|uniref:translation initiation factor 2A n=1 Tax=Trichomonascus vanleenenianus TaxID=2268995 RepID=UPI003ECB6D45
MTTPSVTQFYSRLPKSATLTNCSDYEPLKGFEAPNGVQIRATKYSEDGQYFAYATPSAVVIVNPDTGAVATQLDLVDVIELGFSPRASYLLTWQRPKRDEAGNFAPNLKIWNVSDGSLIESVLQKQQTPWSVQYTKDERYSARLVTSGLIQVYEANNFRNPSAKLNVEGATQFSLSPGQNYSIAVFVPESKGRPAAVRVYQIPSFQNPVSQKTFFKADKIQMKWNKLGTALLVLASTDVDTSGKSYYGETNLYLLGIAGSYDSRIHLDKEGTIHSFDWSPNSREFGVVYGYMPAKTTIFDARGNEIHSFPVASRNTLEFSPHGRFIILAGFGNLQGTMDVYDRQKQFQKVSTIEAANTSVCEWSPDGKFILTATTSPRLRVDNGVRIWHYTGKLIYAIDHEELFGVGWRPQDVALHPLRNNPSPAPSPHRSTQTVKSIKPVVPSGGAYRPPHARIPGVSVAQTSLHERELQQQARQQAAYKVPGAGGATRVVPGSQPLSKSAQKNKKKRENKKNTEPASPAPAEPAATTNGTNDNAPTGSSPEDKKIRSLLKKLRAIEQLRQRQDSGDKLEDTQLQKIATEPAVKKELASLGWKN